MSDHSSNFARAADYFEGRAFRSRDPAQRRCLRDVADFYRSLARITVGLPKGFNINGTPYLDRNRRWEARASYCRALAEQIGDHDRRAQLLRLAETYDQLAINSVIPLISCAERRYL